MPVDGARLSDRGGYGVLSGTSSAAPHAAGGAALWLSRHPDATPAEVRRALITAGNHDWDHRDDPPGTTAPLLDVSSF